MKIAFNYSVYRWIRILEKTSVSQNKDFFLKSKKYIILLISICIIVDIVFLAAIPFYNSRVDIRISHISLQPIRFDINIKNVPLRTISDKISEDNIKNIHF